MAERKSTKSRSSSQSSAYTFAKGIISLTFKSVVKPIRQLISYGETPKSVKRRQVTNIGIRKTLHTLKPKRKYTKKPIEIPKWIGDKEKNKDVIIRLYKKKESYPAKKIRSRYERQKLFGGKDYDTVVAIEFECLNYYGRREETDPPNLETKTYVYTIRGVLDKNDLSKRMKDIVKMLENYVNYRSKKGQFVVDDHGERIPTNLEFVRVKDIIKWNKVRKVKRDYKLTPKEVEEEKIKQLKFYTPDQSVPKDYVDRFIEGVEPGPVAPIKKKKFDIRDFM